MACHAAALDLSDPKSAAVFLQVVQQQQQAFQQMTQESMSIYVNLFDSPLSYSQQEGSEGTKEHARIAIRTTDRGLRPTEHGEVAEKMSVLSVDELHKV